MTHDRICRSPATDDQDSRADLWCWAERVTWQGSPGLHVPPRVRLACPGVSLPLAGADVHDQLPGPQIGLGNDAPGPLVNERVPAPRSP